MFFFDIFLRKESKSEDELAKKLKRKKRDQKSLILKYSNYKFMQKMSD
jgi:hypothetical protein